MTGTKRDILALLMERELSAADLAERLGVTGAAIRQHVQSLEAAGLVDKRKLGGKPSRPTFLYRLSETGKQGFPHRHDLLLSLLIDEVRDREGPARVEALLRAAAARLAGSAPEAVRHAEGRGGWPALLAWLEQELAWHARGERDGAGGRRIVIHQCPFSAVSGDHPQVCGAFFTELLRVLRPGLRFAHDTACQPPVCCALSAPPPSDPA
jgi:predicted ArsR family transcriptional regulator